MPRAVSDVWLGARLAATGGFEARLRATLTASGVALGVALLLFAASVPHMLSDHNVRLSARVPQSGSDPQRTAQLVVDQIGTSFHGTGVSIVALQQTGPHPAVPPGITHVPAPGMMLVSPALKSLLASSAGAELGRRLHARVAGTISDAGLSGPGELFAYVGATGLLAHGGSPVISFGEHASGADTSPLVTLLVILMVVGLLLPIGVFVATASRFGSEQRNARLAALRLLGLDRAGTARVAAGEALFGAIAGVVVGIVGFALVLRPLVPLTDIAGISVFTQDVRPVPVLALLALVLVPVAAVGFALLAMRQVAIEPLGVSRQGRPPRRRLLWRLGAPVLGFLLLAGLIGADGRLSTTGGEVEAAAGIILVLVGVCALLPWLVEAAVLRAGASAGGSVAWLLALRRLRLDHGTSGRVVGAIGLAVAGAIALQTVFSGAEHTRYTRAPGALRGLAQITEISAGGSNTTASVAARLRAVPGVSEVVVTGGTQADPLVSVAPCATITEVTDAAGCTAGSVYTVSDVGESVRPGQTLKIDGRTVKVPAGAARTAVRPSFSAVASFIGLGAVLATPVAAGKLGLRATTLSAMLRIRDAADQDRLWDTVSAIDPLAQANVIDEAIAPRDQTLDKLRRVLGAGAVAVLLVIGASLLVSVIEQLRERRRVLAVMAAFGTRSSTLAYSVLWQTALPVGLGMVLAIALGVGLGAVLMEIVRVPVAFDWGSVVLLAGAGIGVVVAVTLLTLPVLRSQIGPEALRAE